VDRTGKKGELTGKKGELAGKKGELHPSNPRGIRRSALYKQEKTYKNAPGTQISAPTAANQQKSCNLNNAPISISSSLTTGKLW
jgi:hypothetical protein